MSSEVKTLRSFAVNHDCTERFQKNLAVEPERPASDVFLVQGNPLRKSEVIAPTDLPQASETWAHCGVLRPCIAIEVALAFHARARAHETHVTSQHVPVLGLLIQTEPPNEFPDRDDARVVV